MNILLCCLLVILPNGQNIQASRVDIYPDTKTVVIVEAPLFGDSFE